MQLISRIALTGAVALIGISSISNPAYAIPTYMDRHQIGNAADNCQSALPIFDVQIRKRPLAVQNEGDTSAFITCAFSTTGAPHTITINLGSTASTPQDVTCTGVFGYIVEGEDVYYVVKTLTLPGNNSTTKMTWNGDDFDGVVPASPIGISCNLLPETGVRTTHIQFKEVVSP